MTSIMEPMAKMLKPAEIRELKDDEYLNEESGLICCGVCHTLRQIRQSFLGKEFVHDCLCRCQAHQLEQETAERQEIERMDEISRMKTEGLQDKYLRDYTFENDEGYNPKEMTFARKYVSEWETMKEKGKGLLLWGDVGTGKSFIAGCIANALIEQRVPVLMTNFPKIMNALTSNRDMDKNAYVDSLNKYSLLILDDLGVGNNTPYSMAQMFHVIDSRYRSKKPMIVTTNTPLDEMRFTGDLDLKRIYDRIQERCTPVKVNSVSIRRQKTACENEEMRSLLSACG